MKLEDIHEAWVAVTDLADAPLDPRVLHGLTHAEEILAAVRDASFQANQAEVAGELNGDLRARILHALWERVIAP